MRISTRLIGCLAGVLSLAVSLKSGPTDPSEKRAADPPKPLRVLFVGNSQVYFNDLPRIVEALAESAAADRPRVRADRAVAGGASLESHWNRGTGQGTARAMIAEGKWDYVILQ